MARLYPLVAFFLLLLPSAALAADHPADQLAEARERVDAGRPQEALPLLDRLIKRAPKSAEALLLRSTVQFLLGDEDKGRRDLDRALELDPGLRQGWLNRAALQIADQKYQEALASLEKARQLDPAAPDNELNLGAVRLLLGDLDAATDLFQHYLAANPQSADAQYLVATNYAMAGYAGLALSHLHQAIVLREQVRLRARRDPNFSDLSSNPRFQDLMSSDLYTPPPGAYSLKREVGGAYDGGQGPLLPAVLDSLMALEEPFESSIEVTPGWALIWGDLRIKLTETSAGEGEVELFAPADRFTPAEWQARTERLLQSIRVQLSKRRLAAGKGSR
jgi:tetratricopeptide (TPR) repeat protein